MKCRTSRSTACGRCLRRCPASLRLLHSAAASAGSSCAWIPKAPGSTVLARRSGLRRQSSEHRRAIRQRSNGRPDSDRVDERDARRQRPGIARCARCASATVRQIFRDVGTITDTADIIVGYAHVNGKRTVYIPVTKRADASTLDVIRRVRQALPAMRSVAPEDVKIDLVFDRSR